METWRTVYNFITLCIILDELIASPNGEHRVGNNFCLRFVDAEAVIENLCDLMANYGNIYEVPSNMRYSSINFASLRKFGTVEFRSLECTTDLNRVSDWINVCQRIKEVSRGFQTPIDIIGLFSKYNEEEFLNRVLGAFAAVYSKVPGYKLMLKRGMRIAQDFAYSSQWVSAEKSKQPNPWAPSFIGADQPAIVGDDYFGLVPAYEAEDEAEEEDEDEAEEEDGGDF
jgi:hypothetical protein